MNEVAIKEFEGYTMDTESGRVFSYRNGGRKELKPFVSSRGRKIIYIWTDGKRWSFGYNRLWYCVICGVPLKKMPKDLCVTIGQDGMPKLIDEAERARIGYQRRAESIRRYRMHNMERKMMELQMMMEYYKTDNFTPIAAYAESLRDNMVRWFCHYYGSGKHRADEAYEVACTRLEHRVNNPHSQICDILLMLKNEMANVYREKARERKLETQAAYEAILAKPVPSVFK